MKRRLRWEKLNLHQQMWKMKFSAFFNCRCCGAIGNQLSTAVAKRSSSIPQHMDCIKRSRAAPAAAEPQINSAAGS